MVGVAMKVTRRGSLSVSAAWLQQDWPAQRICRTTATTTNTNTLGAKCHETMENDGMGRWKKGSWRVLPKAGACCSVVYSGLELPGCSVPPAVDCEGATSYRVAPLTRIGDGARIAEFLR